MLYQLLEADGRIVICCPLIRIGVVLVWISVNSYYPNFTLVEERESALSRINYSLRLPSCLQTSCDRATIITESSRTHLIDHSTGSYSNICYSPLFWEFQDIAVSNLVTLCEALKPRSCPRYDVSFLLTSSFQSQIFYRE